MSNLHEHRLEQHYSTAFAVGIGLNVGFVAVEIVYGVIANSSALLADAGHNASDVLSLVFAWTATWLATLKPKGKYTYGLRKSTILVSILNALLLVGAVIVIAWDVVAKFRHPEPVAGSQVMIVAGIGVVINTVTALLFIRGQKHDLNIKGAFLHMAADAGVSLGVVIAGLLITMTGSLWIDPITSFIIIAVILWSTWALFRDSLDLALDAVPRHIDFDKVREFILSKEPVKEIHDLHIWAMSTTQVALTAHLVMPGGQDDTFLVQLREDIRREFGIEHTTLQVESGNLQLQCRPQC